MYYSSELFLEFREIYSRLLIDSPQDLLDVFFSKKKRVYLRPQKPYAG